MSTASSSFNLTTSAPGAAVTVDRVNVQFDPGDPQTAPIITNASGDTLATWNKDKNKFVAENSDTKLDGTDINNVLTNNNNNIQTTLNSLIYQNTTEEQRDAFEKDNTFKPFSVYRESQQDALDWSNVLQNVEDVDIEIDSVGVRGIDPTLPPYKHYYYPADLESSKQDRIKFSMKSYGSKTIRTGSIFGQDFMVRKFKKIEGSVTLPINPNIQDQNTVNWQGGTLNALESRGAGIAMSLMNSQSWEQVGNQVANIFAQTTREIRNSYDNYGSDLINAMQVYLAQQAVGSRNLLSRTTGAIVNPNLELLFEAPQLRSFQFQFQLSPRDDNEAKHTKQLIRFFKQGMSVKSSSSNVFLKAPNVFDIRYITFSDRGREIEDHPSIGRIKTAALTSCNVNYTPDGTYMTYADDERTMTSYRVSLQFTELNPVYEDDYNNRNVREEDGTWSRPLSTREVGY